jgi:hypothetical protein
MFRFVMVALAGCVLASGCTGGGISPVVADLEVFNRTVEDLLYIAADGEVLEVPACGNASDPTFRIDVVTVRAEGGYVRTFGAADQAFAGRRLFVVEVARAADSGLPNPGPPPDPLPPCEGHPQAQRGR